MSHLYLEDVKILDFTTRLPGPLSSYLLLQFGAEVTKVENTDTDCDSFLETPKQTSYFKLWYNQINTNKQIKKISFQSDYQEIVKLIKRHDIILAPDNSYYRKTLDKQQAKVYLWLSGGKDQFKYMHDLNALSFTKSFKLHLQDTESPPYLPIAGISFAQTIATTAVAMLRKAEKTQTSLSQELYLKDNTENIFDSLPMSSQQNTQRFLHNGAYPCYSIYESKDESYLCLAAVEEHFWKNLCSVFSLKLLPSDRFDQSGETTNLLKKTFANYTANEIRTKIHGIHTCLTIVKN